MKDIDELIREEMRDAQQTPPPELWQQLSDRMARQHSARKPRRTLRTALIATAAVGLAAAIALLARSAMQHSDRQAPTTAALQPAEQIMAAATTALEQTDTPQPAAGSKPAAQRPRTLQPTAAQPVAAQPPASMQPATAPQPATPHPASATATLGDEQTPAPAAREQRPVHPIDAPTATAAETPATTQSSAATDGTATQSTPSPEQPRPQLAIPTLLTPNGDGINDCWVIPNLEQYGHAQVQIYTAQSQRIYSSNDYRNDFCGDGLPEGNYFYVLVLRDYNYSRRGVFVIRK